jgi:hypothetical protein
MLKVNVRPPLLTVLVRQRLQNLVGYKRTLRSARAAFAAEWSVGVLQRRGELAGGQGVEGAETGVEFGGGQMTLAIEKAEKIGCRTFAFQRIAFEAAGDEVAVGVAAGLDAGDDVVQALDARVGATKAIKTMTAFAEVDGLAQGASLEEVELLEVDGRVGGPVRAGGIVHGEEAGTRGGNLIGKAHVDDVAAFAAMDETQGAENDEAANRFAHGAGANANSASEPRHGEAELELAFEATVADEVKIDSAVGDGHAQPREKNVRELFPQTGGVGLFGFHGRILKGVRTENAEELKSKEKRPDGCRGAVVYKE